MIEVSQTGAITVTGKDSIETYRLIALRSALRLWERTGIIPQRGVTISHMLKLSSEVTGKRYPRSKKGAVAAQADLGTLLESRKS